MSSLREEEEEEEERKTERRRLSGRFVIEVSQGPFFVAVVPYGNVAVGSDSSTSW